jgi:predicted trehalose synthase
LPAVTAATGRPSSIRTSIFSAAANLPEMRARPSAASFTATGAGGCLAMRCSLHTVSIGATAKNRPLTNQNSTGTRRMSASHLWTLLAKRVADIHPPIQLCRFGKLTRLGRESHVDAPTRIARSALVLSCRGSRGSSGRDRPRRTASG